MTLDGPRPSNHHAVAPPLARRKHWQCRIQPPFLGVWCTGQHNGASGMKGRDMTPQNIEILNKIDNFLSCGEGYGHVVMVTEGMVLIAPWRLLCRIAWSSRDVCMYVCMY